MPCCFWVVTTTTKIYLKSWACCSSIVSISMSTAGPISGATLWVYWSAITVTRICQTLSACSFPTGSTSIRKTTICAPPWLSCAASAGLKTSSTASGSWSRTEPTSIVQTAEAGTPCNSSAETIAEKTWSKSFAVSLPFLPLQRLSAGEPKAELRRWKHFHETGAGGSTLYWASSRPVSAYV